MSGVVLGGHRGCRVRRAGSAGGVHDDTQAPVAHERVVAPVEPEIPMGPLWRGVGHPALPETLMNGADGVSVNAFLW